MFYYCNLLLLECFLIIFARQKLVLSTRKSEEPINIWAHRRFVGMGAVPQAIASDIGAMTVFVRVWHVCWQVSALDAISAFETNVRGTALRLSLCNLHREHLSNKYLYSIP